MRETGCLNNVHILNEIIKADKRRGLVAIQLDITKAFDTIPHLSTDAALKYLGLSSEVRSSIVNSYGNISTIIEHNKTKIDVLLEREVKQGDPLSPFISNAILDTLLIQLEGMKGFQIRDNLFPFGISLCQRSEIDNGL
jgi:hypothetical protein